MRIFTTETHIINIERISSVNKKRGTVCLDNGQEIMLSVDEKRNLELILAELHRQSCSSYKHA